MGRPLQPHEIRGDARPGRGGGFEHATVHPIDMSDIPQITDAEAALLADQTKVGSPEHDRAHEKLLRIRNMIRWAHREYLGDDDGSL